MLAEVGAFTTLLSLLTALYGSIALARGTRRQEQPWAASGRNAVIATSALLGLALLLLLAAFVFNQFSITYVAGHSSRELPLYLKFSALWAGQEGSLLLWCFLQAFFAAIIATRAHHENNGEGLLFAWATVFLSAITAFFVAITLTMSNPFRQTVLVPGNGSGLNPLLRHPGMIFHPPALYVGYVVLALPFSFALAALITGRMEDWPESIRRWTLVGWFFLGLGMLLGARWAYDVLGWGGYWGWDPVENAALMPWLTATALLHGLVIQQQRGNFRGWNSFLSVLTFILVLFGTFTTRSGLIRSVHAFSRSSIGYYFLGFMLLSALASVYLAYRGRETLKSRSQIEGFISRQGMFLLTVIIFLTLTASVFVGSILPTITEALTGNRYEAGPEWFDRVTGPQFAALIFIMGVCPLLAASLRTTRRLGMRAVPALVAAVALVVGMALIGFSQLSSIVGFAVIGLAGGTALSEYIFAVMHRRRENETPFGALRRLFGENRRRYGGYLVHIGIIAMAIGVIGTRQHSFERDIVLSPGEPQSVGRYTFVYEESRQNAGIDHVELVSYVSLYENGGYVTTLEPGLVQYVNSQETTTEPAQQMGLREDVYVVLGGVNDQGASVTLKVTINPLVSFLWLGGLIFLTGGVVAMWPAPAKAVTVPSVRLRQATTVLAVLTGIALLAAAGFAMWSPHNTSARQSGRPLPGQVPPGFILTTLEGTQISLADMKGQVVVINFWATWCDSCAEELPALQRIWEDYQGKGVGFVGLAYQETVERVQAGMAQYGLTYPLGLDSGEVIANSYGVTGLPETFVIDQNGAVAYVHIGAVSENVLRQELDSLLEI